MACVVQLLRWLPLASLVILAVLFEPIRSGLVFENQSCDFALDGDLIKLAVFNSRHIFSYGLLFLVAAATFKTKDALKIAMGVFVFSAFLEYEQSFFDTGHCRLRDLIPNCLGIGGAVIVYKIYGAWKDRIQPS